MDLVEDNVNIAVDLAEVQGCRKNVIAERLATQILLSDLALHVLRARFELEVPAGQV